MKPWEDDIWKLQEELIRNSPVDPDDLMTPKLYQDGMFVALERLLYDLKTDWNLNNK
jgi:hypothetical protein